MVDQRLPVDVATPRSFRTRAISGLLIGQLFEQRRQRLRALDDNALPHDHGLASQRDVCPWPSLPAMPHGSTPHDESHSKFVTCCRSIGYAATVVSVDRWRSQTTATSRTVKQEPSGLQTPETPKEGAVVSPEAERAAHPITQGGTTGDMVILVLPETTRQHGYNGG